MPSSLLRKLLFLSLLLLPLLTGACLNVPVTTLPGY